MRKSKINLLSYNVHFSSVLDIREYLKKRDRDPSSMGEEWSLRQGKCCVETQQVSEGSGKLWQRKNET